LGSMVYIIELISPYVASSKHIAIPVGNIGGIAKIKKRRIGAISPTASAHHGPQKNPHSITGICIGQRAFPICGTCPVTKGNTSASAKNIADKIIFLRVLLFDDIFFSLSI